MKKKKKKKEEETESENENETRKGLLRHTFSVTGSYRYCSTQTVSGGLRVVDR